MNTDTDWLRRRRCEMSEAEVFFPHPNSDGADAKEICAECPVVAECLKYAIDPATKQDAGVWGGMTEHERRALIRRMERKNRSGQAGATISVNPHTEDERCGTYAGTRAHRRRLEWLCDDCRDARSTYEMDRRRKQLKAAS